MTRVRLFPRKKRKKSLKCENHVKATGGKIVGVRGRNITKGKLWYKYKLNVTAPVLVYREEFRESHVSFIHHIGGCWSVFYAHSRTTNRRRKLRNFAVSTSSD
jgi:hypothetical protein